MNRNTLPTRGINRESIAILVAGTAVTTKRGELNDKPESWGIGQSTPAVRFTTASCGPENQLLQTCEPKQARMTAFTK